MRLAASLLALTLALPALPALAADDDLDRPSPRAPSDALAAPDDGGVVLAQYAPAPRPAPYATRPAPAPYARPAPAPAPAPRGGRPYRTYAGPGGYAVGTPPFWGGWGWGWGYYPLYPAYPAYPAYSSYQQPYEQPYPPGDAGPGGYYPPGPGGYYPPGAGYYPAVNPDRVLVRLGAAAAGMSDGAVGGFTLALDTRTVGFSAAVDALAIDNVTRVGDSGGDRLGWGSAHLTFSVLADASFRVRLEVGGSMLSLPTTGAFAGTTRAGEMVFGPDMGISAQLGLVGPIGVEGHVRVTPTPVEVLDSRLALALRGGPFAVTAGWRGIRLYGETGQVPDVDFSGPELGVSVVF